MWRKTSLMRAVSDLHAKFAISLTKKAPRHVFLVFPRNVKTAFNHQ